MSKVLLTGFEPFLNYKTNPSGDMATKLNGETISGNKIVGKVLPVKHVEAREILDGYIKDAKPDKIIALGLAGTKGCISLERIAMNRYYFRDGKEEIDEPLEEGGKDAYFSTLPLDAIKEELQRNNIPAEFSFFPDTYVSNEIFYEVMKVSETLKLDKAGFIHIPLAPRQVVDMDRLHYAIRERVPSMDENMVERAIRIIIGVTCKN